MLAGKDKANAAHAPGKGPTTAGAAAPGKTTRVEQELGKSPGKGGGGDDDNSVMTAKHETDGQIHMVTDAGLRHLRKANPKAAKTLFDNPNAYIVLKNEGQKMPEGWKGKATVLFKSYFDLRDQTDDGKHALPNPSIQAVVYDNEHWSGTSDAEKGDPSKYAKLFLELTHKLGLTFIAAPTREFLAADAKYADIVDVQLQDREDHTNSYLSAMRHDIKLARGEHAKAYKQAEHADPHLAKEMTPGVKVVGQVTSNVKYLDPHGPLTKGEHHAETDIAEGENPTRKNQPALDGFWGYLYQGSHAGPKRKHSVEAGDHVLADLAKREDKGQKV